MSEPGKVTSRAQVECLYRGGAGWKESVNMDEINKGKNMAESQAQGFLNQHCNNICHREVGM